MPSERQCKGTNQAGEPCESPFVRENGYCSAHGPGAAERMQLRGYQGAKASKASKRKDTPFSEDELPELDSFASAATWTDRVGRAVAGGRLSPTAGNVLLRAVREFRSNHESGEQAERLEQLLDALAAWKKTGNPDRVLKLVEAGGK